MQRDSIFLNAAIDIATTLLAKRKQNAHGIYWETLGKIGDKFIYHSSENVYDGNAGIALFFIELYKQTQYDEYKEVAIQTLNWVLQEYKKDDRVSHAFVTGRLGIAYVLIQFYKLFQEELYLYEALAIAEKSVEYLEKKEVIHDFINGTSGMLWALLYLHQATQEERLLVIIDQFIERILKDTEIHENGFFWDRSSESIKGLCGFSHGASGLGFIFAELSRYFENEAFNSVAHQAFAYENAFFNKKVNNYPDFRKGIFSQGEYEEQKQRYIDKDLDFFCKPAYMNAWCHGAAGIGLARLRAFEIFMEEEYLENALNCIAKTSQTDVESTHLRAFNLCHASGGNAELFLEAYKVLGEVKYLDLARSIGEQAIAFKQSGKPYLAGLANAKNLPCNSLFNGDAGVGYFYLRLHNPVNVPSLLCPELGFLTSSTTDSDEYPNITIFETNLKIQFTRKNFQRTFDTFQQLYPDEVIDFLIEENRLHPETAFFQWVEQMMPNVAENHQKLLADVFNLEKKAQQMNRQIVSDALLNISEMVHQEKYTNLFREGKTTDGQLSFLQKKLQINPEIELVDTQWNWQEAENIGQNIEINAGEKTCSVLLKPSITGTIEAELTNFSQFVLAIFEDVNSIEAAIARGLDDFEVANEEEKQQVEDGIIEQIKQFLKIKALVFVEE